MVVTLSAARRLLEAAAQEAAVQEAAAQEAAAQEAAAQEAAAQEQESCFHWHMGRRVG